MVIQNELLIKAASGFIKANSRFHCPLNIGIQV
jgi:hypothetical protein